MDYYKVAIICTNGHWITDNNNGDRAGDKHCYHCGAETISSCTVCETPIRGNYVPDAAAILTPRNEIPHFCRECGAPYPWTQKLVSKTKMLVDMEEALSEAEKQQVVEIAQTMASETNTSVIDAALLKKIAFKAGGAFLNFTTQLVSIIAAEAFKKAFLEP